jgi:hypothetical protein
MFAPEFEKQAIGTVVVVFAPLLLQVLAAPPTCPVTKHDGRVLKIPAAILTV